MSNEPATTAPKRLVSLDAFRGLTIAGMILVNNPGSWQHIYSPLRHAEWNGWTPTDLVFPFFLFIVGVSMAFSFRKRTEGQGDRRGLMLQVVRRTIVLFALGLIMAGYPDYRLIGPYVLLIVGVYLFSDDRTKAGRTVAAAVVVVAALAYFAIDFGYFDAKHLRVPGVLQRIAVCYFLASIIVLTVKTPGRVACIVVLLAGYWWVVASVHAPDGYTADVTGESGLLHDWIDVQVLGSHLYRERPDPEGLLSTLPAIATVLLGILTGSWLQSPRDGRDKLIGLFIAANVCLFVGLCLDDGFPINKKIWTSSYVVFTAGLALHVLAMCYWLIDLRSRRGWALPLIVFGTNAIVVYVASSLTAKTLGRWMVASGAGEPVSAKSWIYEHVFLATWSDPVNASLAYALSYVALWCLLLVPLHRWRVFVKI